jgi:F0F1-type ATP synthase epsilon subunit
VDLDEVDLVEAVEEEDLEVAEEEEEEVSAVVAGLVEVTDSEVVVVAVLVEVTDLEVVVGEVDLNLDSHQGDDVLCLLVALYILIKF